MSDKLLEGDFSWKMLGDIGTGREHLGQGMPVIVYRLFQYTMRAVLAREYGKETMIRIFRESGKLAGKEFAVNVLDLSLDQDAFAAQLQAELRELSIGILRFEQFDAASGHAVLTVSEDLDCSGLPVTGECVCNYDEGFIAGILETYMKNPYYAVEVDCWSKGRQGLPIRSGSVKELIIRVSDIEKLSKLIQDTSENIETEDIRIDGLSPEFQKLGEEICEVLRQGQEITRFTASLSDGDLTVPVPPRSNYMAGPVKDLYYKLKHLEWQTNQVADGDYSQHVDFLGSFSDAFNRMTAQLKQREEMIRTQAEEQIRAVNRENQMMERQMEIQYASYQAYREYTESFLQFRSEYKTMMGEVYALFQQKKYEEARQLVAQVNDRMGSRVNIRRDYSNHDYINAALTDISSFCKQRNIALNAMVHVPNGFYIEAEISLRLLNHTSELVYLLLSNFSGAAGSSLNIHSTRKSVWLSIVASYFISEAVLPKHWPPEILRCEDAIRESAQRANAVFSLTRSKDGHTAECILHLPDRRSTENTGIMEQH